MAGLDRVKGPHWSQILAMFGPGGTINEVLKDRNQVQLKDKARNLKLFFLKSGIEVPYYLQFVTGELKTRAPAQAAKNEAKDREMAREDRAHVEGLMALAGGSMQESDQTMTELEDQADREMQNGDVALADASNSHGTIIDNLTASVGMQDWIDGPRSNANPGLSGMEEMVRAAQDGHRERRTQQAQMLPTNGHPDGVANRGSTGRSASFNPQFLGAHKTVVDSSNTDPALLA